MGTEACDEHKLDETIDKIGSTHSYWLFTGDGAEYINRSDPRFDPDNLANWISMKDLKDVASVQRRQLEKKLRPIIKTNIGFMEGNHEKMICKHSESDIQSEICENLGVKNLTSAVFMNLFFRAKKRKASYLVRLVSQHPSSSLGGQVGGKINKAIRHLHNFDADIFALPHFHQKNKTEVVIIGSTETENPTSKELCKMTIQCGSYLRTYAKGLSTYGEDRMYDPVPLGSPFIDIWQERKYEGKKDFFETRME